MKRFGWTLAVVLAIAGCNQAAVAPSSQGAGPTPTPTSPPTAVQPTPKAPVPTEFVVPPQPEPTEDTSGPSQYLPGETITVTSNGSNWANIVVDRVKVVSEYGAGTYFPDKPASGNVYIQARITYTALANGVDYNQFDWAVFVGGTAVDNTAFVTNGPTPELGSGTLPKGRKASGYVVYEVAKTGEVLLDYQSNSFTNDAPVFEVVLRSK